MPIDLTGIQNVGEFYSHHYLDALLENDLKGLFAKWQDAGASDSPDQRLARLSSEFFKAKSLARPELSIQSRYEPSHKIHVDLLEALGYDYDFGLRFINGKIAVPLLGTVVRDGHEYIWLLETPFPGREDYQDEDSSPFDQRPFRQQYPRTEEEFFVPEERWEDLIGDIFASPEPPRWLILFAGRWIYLVDRTKWGRGQYLLFDLDEIFGRRQAPTLRAAAALLSRDALCPSDGLPLHDTLDENSHKHAYAVSSNLKYGLRKAVELLANEYVWYTRNVSRQPLFQDEALGHKLTEESLTYLYRLLFLLYAEARAGELDVVPMKAEAYQKGYSLEALRDLEQVPLTTPQAQTGYFINDSLTRLFTLVNEGHNPAQLALPVDDAPEAYDDYGFRIEGLHSPLFSRESTPLLSSVRFRNSVLQEVIQLLSLSRETRGRRSQRGRISYAQLGINQLGAVYEALLSYSGFFAAERMYEVKPADSKDADETQQTYFIPESELSRYLPEEFVYVERPDGTRQRKSYEKGSFIFRLAGRDREKSASYYTPEVLTQCVVKYSLKELLKDKSADDILKLTICEPAMGSGAFINEALSQLADAYLERKQQELGKRISPDDYRVERQKVKYYLAVNNAYGVDLNPTAVRLAEVSLWLNIIYPGAPAPWFGARLATGNSLIGARRQVYTAEDVKSGAYASKAPTPVPLAPETEEEPAAGRIRPRPANTIYHWLLPDAGMAAFDRDKVIKELAPAETEAIKKWHKEFTKPFTAGEIKNLIALSDRADVLWQQALTERLVFLEKTHQPVWLWGQPDVHKKPKGVSVQDSERALSILLRPNGAYVRLKLAMDYWCSLWFWPISHSGLLPERSNFLEDISVIFMAGEDTGYEYEPEPEQQDLFKTSANKQTRLPDLKPVTLNELISSNPSLELVRQIAFQQRFHHWDLVFVEVFIGTGGFSLLLGNPPWVNVLFDEAGILSDYDAAVALRKLSSPQVSKLGSQMLNSPFVKEGYFSELVEQIGSMSFLGSIANYQILAGKSNLYKCFLVKAWEICRNGVTGLLHPEGIYDDPGGRKLRNEAYRRLKFHFQFHNELKLFPIAHTAKYSINVYRGIPTLFILFDHLANLFIPPTIDQCYSHDGNGLVPGIRDENDMWQRRGHRNRIIHVDTDLLGLFAMVYDEDETPPSEARLPLVHSVEIVDVLKTFSLHNRKLAHLSDNFLMVPTTIWNETNSVEDGSICRKTYFPSAVREMVYSGPHIYVGNPYNKTPNEACKSHGDYSELDLTNISDNYLARTNYKILKSQKDLSNYIPIWKNKPITDYYRQFFRAMLNPAIEHTLIGCIAPPETTHINAIRSFVFDNNELLLTLSSMANSIVYDFYIKSTGKQNLHELATLLPMPQLEGKLRDWLYSRTLCLNCLTKYYAGLWEELFSSTFSQDSWSRSDQRLKSWTILTPLWQRNNALRTHFERRQALVEIDVLAALVMGLTVDELLTIYHVQFPVLQKNERRLLFDQRGMEVPVKTVGGVLGVDESHPRFAEMVPPFTPVDREEDYRVAWKFFEERLGKNTEGGEIRGS